MHVAGRSGGGSGPPAANMPGPVEEATEYTVVHVQCMAPECMSILEVRSAEASPASHQCGTRGHAHVDTGGARRRGLVCAEAQTSMPVPQALRRVGA
eukprot:349741-Chlamydomonas_euryale.AAC.9